LKASGLKDHPAIIYFGKCPLDICWRAILHRKSPKVMHT
jgi:hypothetical protein